MLSHTDTKFRTSERIEMLFKQRAIIEQATGNHNQNIRVCLRPKHMSAPHGFASRTTRQQCLLDCRHFFDVLQTGFTRRCLEIVAKSKFRNCRYWTPSKPPSFIELAYKSWFLRSPFFASFWTYFRRRSLVIVTKSKFRNFQNWTPSK